MRIYLPASLARLSAALDAGRFEASVAAGGALLESDPYAAFDAYEAALGRTPSHP